MRYLTETIGCVFMYIQMVYYTLGYMTKLRISLDQSNLGLRDEGFLTNLVVYDWRGFPLDSHNTCNEQLDCSEDPHFSDLVYPLPLLPLRRCVEHLVICPPDKGKMPCVSHHVNVCVMCVCVCVVKCVIHCHVCSV